MLKYCEQITLSGSTGGVIGVERQFGLNCMFDPNLTGVGHQPMGFDELMALYRRYRVWKVDFKLRPFGTGGAPFLAAQVQNSQAANGLSGKDYATCVERSNVATKVIDDPNNSIIFGSFHMSQIEGQAIIDDNYTGGVTGNPGNQIKLILGCGDVIGGDSATCGVTVELVFYATLDHPVSLNAS